MLKFFLFDGEGEAAPAESSTAGEAVNTSETANDGAATQQKEWEDAKARFKDVYHSEMSEAVKGRVKGLNAKNAELTERLEKQSHIFSRLKDRYGTDDPDALADFLDNDTDYIHREAMKRGMSDEATKNILKIENENKRLRAERAAADREARLQQTVQKWRGEETELKKTYPNFDLNEEYENPEFKSLLINADGTPTGRSVKSCYMAVHAEDIIRGGVQYAVEKGRQIAADNIMAGMNRPTENGISSQGAISTKKSIKDMSAKEIDDIDARVQRGERIDASYFRS